jgi:hypothetical protein
MRDGGNKQGNCQTGVSAGIHTSQITKDLGCTAGRTGAEHYTDQTSEEDDQHTAFLEREEVETHRQPSSIACHSGIHIHQLPIPRANDSLRRRRSTGGPLTLFNLYVALSRSLGQATL